MHVKNKRLARLLFVFLCAGIGCGGGSGDNPVNATQYSFKNVPSKYSVSIPSSLVGSSTKSKSVLSARGFKSFSAEKKTKGSSGTSTAYKQLKEEVSDVSSDLNEFDVEFMIVDAAYDQVMAYLNNASGTVPAGTIKFTFTQEMYNRVMAKYPEDITAFPAVGEDYYIPETSLTLDPDDLDGDGYNFVIKAKCEEIGTNTNLKGTEVLKWSTDKTRVYLAWVVSGTEDSVQVNFDYNISYDQSADLSTMAFVCYEDGTKFTASIMMQGTGDAKNGLKFSEKATATESGKTGEYELTAIADEDGGFVKLKYVDPTEGTIFYKEEFDDGGALLAQAFSADGVNWTGETVTMDESECAIDDVKSLTISSLGNLVTLANGAGFTEGPFSFYVVPSGSSPDNGGNAIGYGFYDLDSSALVESSYWGAESQIGTAVVYLVSFDSDGNVIYTATTATLTRN